MWIMILHIYFTGITNATITVKSFGSYANQAACALDAPVKIKANTTANVAGIDAVCQWMAKP